MICDGAPRATLVGSDARLALPTEAAERAAAYAARVASLIATGETTEDDAVFAAMLQRETEEALAHCRELLTEQPTGWGEDLAEEQRRALAEVGNHLVHDLEEGGPVTSERLAGESAHIRAILSAYAAPWPVRWLFRPAEGDPVRVPYSFAGPGGLSYGLRDVLGVELDVVGVDTSRAAVATSRAAGFAIVEADVAALDPEHPALRYSGGALATPPCQSFSPAGRRNGHETDAIEVVRDVLVHAGAAAGFFSRVDVDGYDIDPAPRTGESWAEVREGLVGLSDARTGLMAEAAIWPLALMAAGAPIEWVGVEQSSALPREIRQGITAELLQAGWGSAEWVEVEAADLGAASRRKRAFLVAHRATAPGVPMEPAAGMPSTSLARALDWAEGEEVNTRGVRGTTANGRPKGGNCFSADGPAWAITSKARTWKRQSDGLRFTPGDIGHLLGFTPEYPWQGSRSGQIEAAADVVSPVAGAALGGALLGIDWETPLRAHLARIYPTADTLRASIPQQLSFDLVGCA